MTHEIVFAGFGGQGVLSMGQVLAYAGMIENKEICWLPSYGPEMRGGTANCVTIVSDSKISSPILARYDTVVALNQPSLDKFEATIKPGGLLLYDSTNIINKPKRTDIEVLAIPASEEAAKLKNMRVLNMIVLGTLLKKRAIVRSDSVLAALRKVLPERYHHLISLNEEALRLGASLAVH